jgi:hypothetical protein
MLLENRDQCDLIFTFFKIQLWILVGKEEVKGEKGIARLHLSHRGTSTYTDIYITLSFRSCRNNPLMCSKSTLQPGKHTRKEPLTRFQSGHG